MTSDQIAALIQQLLKTGEVLGTKAFELAVRQVVVNSYTNAVEGILWILAGILFYAFLQKRAWKEDGAIGAIVLIISALVCTVGISSLLDAFHYYMNPQWYAMKLVVDTFIK